jgi:hypothetical protein
VTSVHAALRARFAPPEWSCLFEVRSAAGFDATRTADAVAMNMWPARGLEVQGVEVKVSRSDWLRELKDPQKSAAVQRYCDRWWIAVSEAAIVKVEELPPTWGLLVMRGEKLVQKVEAPKLEAQPLSRTFVAALLRRAVESTLDTVPRAEVRTAIAAEVKQRVIAQRESFERELATHRQAAAHTEERLRAFEEASGVRLEQWSPADKIGEAVRFVMQNRDALDRGLDSVRSTLERLVAAVDKAKTEVRSAGGEA